MLRDRLAILIAVVFGVFMALQYFSPHPTVVGAYRTVLTWMQIVFAFALVVGILAVLRHQAATIKRKPRQALYPITLLVGVAFMAILGFTGGIGKGSAFLWAFDHMQAPMQQTVFSLLAFFVASATYRGFRARNWESALLVGAGFIVLLGRVPVGEMISPWVPAAVDWIVTVPALAAKRAILIGIGLGMVATALKVIAGIERTYLGRTKS